MYLCHCTNFFTIKIYIQCSYSQENICTTYFENCIHLTNYKFIQIVCLYLLLKIRLHFKFIAQQGTCLSLIEFLKSSFLHNIPCKTIHLIIIIGKWNLDLSKHFIWTFQNWFPLFSHILTASHKVVNNKI